MAKGMDGFTYFCAQFETSWKTSQKFTCIAIRLLNHAPSMNLKSAFSKPGLLSLRRP